jgi:colanic acid/amylovoran biosynthesis glycosyltransferase
MPTVLRSLSREVDQAVRITYVTAKLPFGGGEPFIVPEILELLERGCDVTVVPVRTGGAVADGDARALAPRTAAVSLASPRVVWAAVREAVRSPRRTGRALLLLRGRSVRILAKNLAVFPKALWLARRLRETRTDHLHAHWAGTSATLAMLAALVADVPWSMTAHRWDIPEDNLLRTKKRRACFVRAISEHGAEEIRRIVGEADWSPWLRYMGVRLPSTADDRPAASGPLRVLTAARFVETKGHVHLVEATRLLVARGVDVRVDLAGDGPVEPQLRKRVAELGLTGSVEFLGRVPHDELLEELGRGRWDVVALASDVEGIPVSLLEAMAYGLPVVGTRVGGIPELLTDEVGLLVPPGDPPALADALEQLARDPAARASLGARGRARVEEAFSVEQVAAELEARFLECGRD